MGDLAERIATLPPERRRLLEELARKAGRGGAVADALAAPESHRGLSAQGLDPAKTECRRAYNDISESLDSTPFGQFSYFLNYGYVPTSAPQFSAVELPEHYLNKNSVRLVLEAIGDCDIEGRRVLDVGCGRGGTVYVLKQFFRPASVCAIDLSSAAIAYCRRVHRYAEVSFAEGDAERLEFPDASFDAVTNVESSSCYPNVFAFYDEVLRVLAPGGWFLYTDCMEAAKMRDCLAYLRNVGFEIERDRDITGNVLLSCDEISVARIDAYGASDRTAEMANFLGAPGSHYYECMRSGLWTYRIVKARKPAG